MANIRLYQFPSKASPVPADIVYVGDSAASFDEVQTTIAELIGAYPNLSGIGGLTLGANTYPYVNNSSVFTAGSITSLAVTLLADSTIAQMQSTLGNTATPTASQFAGWDANKNLSANNMINAYTTTATAAATTTLTVGSTFQQFFTGSTTQTVVLPVTSTLVLGQSFYIVNNSSGNVTVQSSGLNNIQVMGANTTLLVTCILTSGTSAASWYADYNFQNALTLPLSLAQGGTNAALTAVAGGVAYSSASAIAFSAAGTSGQLFQSAGTGAPGWTTTTYPATNAINTLLYASSANVMSALATVSAGVLTTSSGVPTWVTTGLGIALGGTGVTSVTTAAAATAWAGWDANKNMSANSFLSAYTTTATAGMTTTLTVASTYAQFFTGSTTQTVVLPVTSTLVLGQAFYIVNNSTGVVTVQSSGGNTVIAMAANTTALVYCILTSGTTAASWFADYVQSGLTLPVSLANGGTNNAITASAGGIVWSDSTKFNVLAGTSTAGLALLSGNAATPSWSTYPPITKVNVQTITATGAYTYTPTTGTQYAIFELQAGGGGTGGASGSAGNGVYTGAASGGNYLKVLVSGTANLAAINGSVGIAGAAGASGNHTGVAGGNTTLTVNSGTTWTATGGQPSGGLAGGSGASNTPGIGSTTSTHGTNATLIVDCQGGSGFDSTLSAAVSNPSIQGHGGQPGGIGAYYGLGGSAAFANGANTAGNAGIQGVVIVTEFISA